LLSENINIEQYVSELISLGSLASNYSIEGCFKLISGMFLSDGITVLDSTGNIRAYNVFVKITKKADAKLNGGARERTYEFLCSKIHKGIIAAFYQSQDGNIKFKGNI
jgi:hypothetical protein